MASQPAATAFILSAFRLEGMQLKLRLDGSTDRDGTSNQAAKLQESRTSILRLL
ncbi:hypothetical protein FA95DRAFT_1613807 [Auriscalpium vulgare]|uniref:Uncharacterized protein n=1 Tax=Auriscalpium vulgare TaxID=40419 RepID=A0ACB8R1A8_9AGAM|nr:hypothetical protein FA95DRAFT_1613807 [Auriscalpium vulgare]